MTRKTLFVGFAFDCSAHPPLYCSQQIDATAEGVEHFIDGKLRAQVPVENAPEYLRAGWVGDIGRGDPRWTDLENMRRMNQPENSRRETDAGNPAKKKATRKR